MIFFSTHCWQLGHELGVDEGLAEFTRQANLDLRHTNEDVLPCVKVLFMLRQSFPVQVWVDPGSSRIAESRCRAFHDFLHSSQCHTWVTCDDDVECDLTTLSYLLSAVDVREPVICSAPYWCRLTKGQEPRISVQLPRSPLVVPIPGGGQMVRMLRGGFGLVAMNRAAAIAVQEGCKIAQLDYTDTHGVTRTAPFLETIVDRFWRGEDIAFFERMPSFVDKMALCKGFTRHAGQVLDLRLLVDGPATLQEVKDAHLDTTREPHA